jgi:hypothetical protein
MRRPRGVPILVLIVLGAAWLPDVAQAAAPTIAASWSTAVAATTANLQTEVGPNGLPTTVRFEYLSEAAFQANLAASPPRDGFAGAARSIVASLNGGSTESRSRQLSGLTPATTYRYRATVAHPAEPEVLGSANAFTTEEIAATFSLPDDRGWEMVSPVDKNGGQIQGPGANFGGDVLQAAAQGNAVTYSSTSSFGEGGQGAAAASQYLSGRESSGWSVPNITAPQRSGAEPEVAAGVPFRIFSPDLSAALLYSGGQCLAPSVGCANPSPPLSGSGAPPGYQDYYLRNNADAGFQALVTAADSPALTLSSEAFSVALAGTTPDLDHVVLASCAALTVEATEIPAGPGCNPTAVNLYEWSGGALRLINLLPGETHGTPGAKLAAQSGAISDDGSRVYFSDGEDSPIYLREAGGPAKLLPETVGGNASFQTASASGVIAFFVKGGTLYRYDAQAETSEPLAAEVLGVLGASEDGSYVYYETAAGLFLRHGTATIPVASEADPGNRIPSTGTARVSPDGTHLLFTSSASITGYDNLDAGTKAPDSEVYLYTASPGGGAGALTCVSCNPTNERPSGPATIPGATANGIGGAATQAYKPRVLSADAARVFFDSSDSLVLQDTNGRPDVYEWEAEGAGSCAKPGGCIGLISSGRDSEPSEFVDASADGADAFFLTDASLVPSDPGSVDLYDAREGGGFPIPPAPIPCEGDACQSLPSEPEDPTPGTLVPAEGNPPVHFPKTHHKKPKQNDHKKHRHGHRHGKGRSR